MFLSVCMCVLVSLCLCVCACMYIHVCTWFGLWSVSPRPAFQSLLQSRTETYLTAARKRERAALWSLFQMDFVLNLQVHSNPIWSKIHTLWCHVDWNRKRAVFLPEFTHGFRKLPHSPAIFLPLHLLLLLLLRLPSSFFFFFLLLSSTFFSLWAKTSGLCSTKPCFHLQTFFFF